MMLERIMVVRTVMDWTHLDLLFYGTRRSRLSNAKATRSPHIVCFGRKGVKVIVELGLGLYLIRATWVENGSCPRLSHVVPSPRCPPGPDAPTHHHTTPRDRRKQCPGTASHPRQWHHPTTPFGIAPSTQDSCRPPSRSLPLFSTEGGGWGCPLRDRRAT